MAMFLNAISERIIYNPRPVFSFLRLVLVFLICWFSLSSVINVVSDYKQKSTGMIAQEGSSVQFKQMNQTMASLSEYKGVLNAENLFGQSKRQKKTASTSENKGKNIEALLSAYEIQGTILGKNPKVLIFDKKNGTTIALAVGEKLGQIEVVAIERSFIRFQLLGETYEAKY